MSKVGIRKINIPEGVQILEEQNLIKVAGPKGNLRLEVPRRIKVLNEKNYIEVRRVGSDKKARAFHGLYRKLIANMIEGVSTGFVKKLDFKGVGFRAEVDGKNLVLNVGFSHPVQFAIADGLEIKVEKNVITVSGIDRQKVGQAAAEIRQIKPVEPYKGKGIKYIDEIPRRKPGKAAKAALGTAK